MTERLSIHPATDADLPCFAAMQCDETAAHMAAFMTPLDAASRVARWHQILADPAAVVRTIRYDGDVAGYVGVFTRDGVLEITYWVARPLWGRGIAARAVQLMLREEATRPIRGRTAEDNYASRRVLEKCGFSIVGRDRGFADARGCEIEELVYELA